MVSIIIPVYNARRYLRQTAGDLLRQSFREIEVIFVDDGSTDGTGRILDRLAEKDERVRVLHTINGGTACARNTGLRAASGEYLMFMDDDDRITRSHVQEYVSAIDESDADIVMGGYRRLAPDGSVLFTRRLVRSRGQDEAVYQEPSWRAYINISPWAKIYRRSFVEACGARFLEYPYGEDLYFQMRLLSANPKTAYSSSVSYGWVDRKESTSNTIHKGIREEADIFPMLEQVLEVHPQRGAFFRYFLYRHCAYHIYTSGRDAEPEKLTQEFRRCDGWLKRNQLLPVLSPLSPRLDGEILRDRMAVLTVRWTARLHMERLFAWIYCRRKKEW